jgi:hypothetical protein
MNSSTMQYTNTRIARLLTMRSSTDRVCTNAVLSVKISIRRPEYMVNRVVLRLRPSSQLQLKREKRYRWA